jgi:hypothetical protein
MALSQNKKFRGQHPGQPHLEMRLMKNMKVMKVIQTQLRLSSFRLHDFEHFFFKKLVLAFKCGNPG